MKLNRPIYLDNLSTTPVDPKVLEEMLPYFNEKFGNESSRTHLYGWEAKESVTVSREKIANLINCNIEELYFTSGTTESINIALKGVLQSKHNNRKHLITFNSEHKATLDVCEMLKNNGYDITCLSVDKEGNIDLDLIKQAINNQTCLLTILHVNNEIGTIYPVKEIGKLCKKNNVIFHVDAAQSVGKINIDVNDMNIDMLSFSSHKIYGPKGIGALYIKKELLNNPLLPILHGGGQENSIRPGTLAVQNIVGFGEACRLCEKNMVDENRKILELRNRLLKGLQKNISTIKVNGTIKNRASGNLNIIIPNIKNNSIMMSLRDIAISNGSACTSNTLETSHVLKAIGLSKELSNSSVRFGIGRFNTSKEIDYTINKIVSTIDKLRN